MYNAVVSPKSPENRIARYGCLAGAVAMAVACCGLPLATAYSLPPSCTGSPQFGSPDVWHEIGPLEYGCSEVHISPTNTDVVRRSVGVGPASVNWEQTNPLVLSNPGVRLVLGGSAVYSGIRDGRFYFETTSSRPDIQ